MRGRPCFRRTDCARRSAFLTLGASGCCASIAAAAVIPRYRKGHMTPELRRWLSDARSIAAKDDAHRYTKHIFNATLKYVAQNQWQGACHATSAILALLLNARNVQAVPCLGECYVDNYYFDHSWIEIDGLVYDVAIAVPDIPSHQKPPVFSGKSVDPTSPMRVRYGVTSGIGFRRDAELVSQMPFVEFLNLFPGHPEGFCGLAVEIAQMASIRITVDELRGVASGLRWHIVADRSDSRSA
jgi:hypothetical protein